jgi:hypothetical protein
MSTSYRGGGGGGGGERERERERERDRLLARGEEATPGEGGGGRMPVTEERMQDPCRMEEVARRGGRACHTR